MNIIHITSISNNKASGISTIVPYHIKYQSKYSNIFWFNINSEYIPPDEFSQFYHSISDYSSCNITMFPKPFSRPNLVVFHGIYFRKYCMIANQLNQLGIPYIIVPHGSLTKSSLKQKALKKRIGFMFLFKKFLRKSIGIQYLTKGEYKLSGDKWNENHIIIPNGCEVSNKQKLDFGHNPLKGVFIGRKSIYHKGLDLLLQACNNIKDHLEMNNCEIHIYGPDENNSSKLLNKTIQDYKLNKIIYVHDSVFDSQKEKVLLNSDFFILTSRFEGHPVALIEALAYGIPCVVTTGTNMSSEVYKSDAGWIADTNVDSIENALVELLKNKSELPIKGGNSYKLAQTFSWENIAQSAINEYKKILIN